MGISVGMGLLQKILVMLFLGIVGYSTVSEFNHPGEQSARITLPDTEAYVTINLRPGISQGLKLKRLIETFSADPAAKASLQNGISDFETKYGINFEHDVMPWLGPEIALGVKVWPAPEGGAMLTWMIGTTNKPLSKVVMDKFLQPDEGRSVTTEQYRGLTITTMTSDWGNELEYFVLTDQYILVASGKVNLSRFKSNIDLILDGGPSLWDDADFQAARNALPGHTGMGYLRLAQLIALDPGNPFLDTIAPYTPSYAAMSFTPVDNGIRFDFFSPTAPGWDFISDQVNPLASVGFVPNNAFGFFAGQNIKAWWDEAKGSASQSSLQFARSFASIAAGPRAATALAQSAQPNGLYVVEGASMEPGFHNGDYVMVLPAAQTIKRSDVVLLTSPGDPNLVMLKRIIGLPGETVEVKDGKVSVNGTVLDEPYVSGPAGYAYGPLVVPAEQYFLLGDNRNSSNDSHNFGPVARSNIVAKVIANIDTDIVSWMTGEFAVAGLPGAGDSAPPAGVVIFQVSDPALVAEKLSRMISAIKDADQPVETYQDTITNAGATMIRWDGQEAGGYLFYNNFLVVGSSRDALAAALNAAGQPALSMAQSPKYQRITSLLPVSKAGLLYADPAAIANFFLGVAGDWERENYFRDSAPWIEPFQATAFSYFIGSQSSTATMVVQVERLFTSHTPFPNPDSRKAVSIQARILGGPSIQQAALHWSKDGIGQPEIALFDDGAHGDKAAGDGIFGVQIGPFPAGTEVTYQVSAADADGNVILAPNYPRPFTYLDPPTSQGDVLLVIDSADPWNAQYYYDNYYRDVINGMISSHDLWDTALRGVPSADDLAPYIGKAVIWASPYMGYLTAGLTRDQALASLQSYLDNGGSLLIAGRDIASDLRSDPFLANYLHARFVQDNVGYGYSSLKGVAGDPITSGMSLYLDWSWNNNEIDPLDPAATILTYSVPDPQPAATVKAIEATGGDTSAAGTAWTGLQDLAQWLKAKIPFTRPEAGGTQATVSTSATQTQAISSTGTAALRVDTGTYKLVYLSFNLEGISPAADRGNLLASALNWLDPALPPVLTSPRDGVPKKPGAVTFAWKEKTGATGYRFQLDKVDAFNSPNLVQVDTQAAQHSVNMSLGVYYWRVKATVADGETEYSKPWKLTIADPVIQVTTDPLPDYNPAAVRTPDGKLWLAWSREKYGSVWYKTSSDGGATWSAEGQLTSGQGFDVYPALMQAEDSKLWLAWVRNAHVWYKISSDNGTTWSAEAQLTGGSDWDSDPAMAQGSDGRLWLVWERNGATWYKTSSDNGATWTPDAQLTVSPQGDKAPSLTVSTDTTIWLVWYSRRSGNADIWYKTSSDNGSTWSEETQFTRFLGYDYSPGVASLADGRVAIVWYSDRAANYDIWFGIPGSLEDTNPPPVLNSLTHYPYPNPDSAEIVTVRAKALDESGILDMSLAWSVNGAAQADVKMWDDGTHGDKAAGDAEYAGQIGPFPPGARIDYQVKISDLDGNTVVRGYGWFTSLESWVAQTNVLLVVDTQDEKFAKEVAASYHNALALLGVGFDLWETRVRGALEQKELGQYQTGAVIWAAPGWNPSLALSTAALRAYLDAGGRLFLSGRNAAEQTRWQDPAFYNNYLHAKFIGYPYLYRALGVPGSIASGLSLDLSNWATEIDPITPAVSILKYDPAATAPPAPTPVPTPIPMLTPAPTPAPTVTPTTSTGQATHVHRDSGASVDGDARITAAPGQEVTAQGIQSSGSGSITVDSGTYRVVYLAFDFESITTAANRASLLEKTFTWLAPELVQGSPPVLVSPADGVAKQPENVTFTWKEKTGATGYRFQLDKVDAFDSPNLVQVDTQSTQYSANMSLGVYYWRVRATVADGETEYSQPWKLTVASPVIPLTTETSYDGHPRMTRTSDGKMWLVWEQNGDIRFKTSSDSGSTWSGASNVTATPDTEYLPSVLQAADGKMWVLWTAFKSGNPDVWYRTSSDNGTTWSAEAQLTSDSHEDYWPTIAQANDGRLVVAWWSPRSGNPDIWYKTSTDNGAAWSADAQLTTDQGGDYDPFFLRTSDGKIWVVWHSYRSGNNGDIYFKTSSDGGISWSADTRLTTDPSNDYWATITQSVEGKIWVAWQSNQSGNDDIRYRTSSDSGTTWSPDIRFTRFVGYDGKAGVASLPDGRVAIAWESNRASGSDIWFGIPGSLEDVNPPPVLNSYTHYPYPNPDSDQVVTVTARGNDETGIADMSVLMSVGGGTQTVVKMWDDGTHGDSTAGDGSYSTQIGPFPTGANVQYQVRVTDVDGNSIVAPQSPKGFQSLAPWTASANVLLVVDGSSSQIQSAAEYYKAALAPLGLSFDVWEPDARGAPEADELGQYAAGAVIWAIISGPAPPPGYPQPPYLRRMPGATSSLRSYLDGGGRLFINGRSIEAIKWEDPAFYQDYLHAAYVGVPYLYRALGVAGDAISNGLSLDLALEGAEIDPLSPATAVFTYDPSATTKPPAGQAILPQIESSASNGQDDPASSHRLSSALAEQGTGGSLEPKSQNVTAGGISKSGTAGLKVSTDTYKVVYLAFDFGAINSQANRATTMEKVMGWLAPELVQSSPPVLLSPADGSAKQPGNVTFAWKEKTGATGYRFQLDKVDTFNSPDLTEANVTGTQHSANLTAGVYYWRVKVTVADGETNYSQPWKLTVASPIIPITSDPASDSAPALVRAADGNLWVAWMRNGDIWYRTSPDNGTTWSADVQLTADPGYDYTPAITETSGGKIWVTWQRGVDILYKASSDGGATWSADTSLATAFEKPMGRLPVTQTRDGKVWLVWQSYSSGNLDIWYKNSSDDGVTWSADIPLTTDPSDDYRPVMLQSADDKVWVVWQSYRAGNSDLWYRSSSDSGTTWSAEAQLTTDPASDGSPSLVRGTNDKLWLIWNRGSAIWYKTSSDNGATWTPDAQLTVGPSGDRSEVYGPSLTVGTDSTIWLVWYSYRSGNADIWYKTTSDSGVTWSAETRFTRFISNDSSPVAAPLADGRVAIAWRANRSANDDIWFGIPGSLEDVNPPPHLDWWKHTPYPNPTSDETVTVQARLSDETGVAGAALAWAKDGAAQTDLPMYDDGAHGDGAAGDNVWSVQIGPLPAGTLVAYQIRVTDTDGNQVLAPQPGISFTSLDPWAAKSDILLVVDSTYPWQVGSITPYYRNALDAAGLKYDTWDTNLRGAPDAGELLQYQGGVVIWGIPYWDSYLIGGGIPRSYAGWQQGSTAPLQAYLTAGGRLFISGQSVAESLVKATFLGDYLHAKYVNSNAGLYSVKGNTGDPITDGLILSLSGGDGANNQYSTDEIDPLVPAVPIFSYNPSATALAAPLALPEAPDPAATYGQQQSPGNQLPVESQSVAAQGVVSSGTAGLRVDTGTYKLVYLSFGFEAISSAADRATLMERVINWLAPELAGEWQVRLVASSTAAGGLQDTDNFAGVAPDASTGYDSNDSFNAPPPPPPFLDLLFPHPDWPAPYDGDYAKDIRPSADSIVWPLQVMNVGFAGDVTITWDIAQVPGWYQSALFKDIETGAATNMRSIDHYTYAAAAGEVRTFELIVGKKAVRSASFLAGWNMFSLPLDIDPADWATQLGDEFSPLYVYHYDPATHGYKMYPSTAIAAQRGWGYWVKALAATTVNVEGMVTPATPFSIHLLPGWVQIGHPFDFPVSWGAVQVRNTATGEVVSIEQAHVNGWVQKYVYWYDTAKGSYIMDTAPSGALTPWRGYWVKALVEADLIIPPTPAP